MGDMDMLKMTFDEWLQARYPKVYGDCPYCSDGKYCLGSWNRPVGLRQCNSAPHKLNDALLSVEDELSAFLGRRWHGYGACLHTGMVEIYAHKVDWEIAIGDDSP